MACDATLWGDRATLTIPVLAMPATFDVENVGRPTHATITVTLEELRDLAITAVKAVMALDAASGVAATLEALRARVCDHPDGTVLQAANFGTLAGDAR